MIQTNNRLIAFRRFVLKLIGCTTGRDRSLIGDVSIGRLGILVKTSFWLICPLPFSPIFLESDVSFSDSELFRATRQSTRRLRMASCTRLRIFISLRLLFDTLIILSASSFKSLYHLGGTPRIEY